MSPAPSGPRHDAASAALPRVSCAGTREVLEAVWRLRYEVYVRELDKRVLPHVDHVREWVRDPEDEQPGAYVFFTGPVTAMTGTLRVQVWEPGRVPPEVHRRFSLDLFPGIERHRVCEAARLVVRASARGGEVLPALACAAFDHVAARHDAFVCFLYCSPGLVHANMRLGFRPYPGLVISTEDGVRLPLLLVASDVAHLEAIGSPLAPLMARHFGAGRSLPDMTPFARAMQGRASHYETDPGRVWEEVRERLAPGPGTPSRFLEGLTAAQAEILCRGGLVMDVPGDRVVIRQGLVERELYLVLGGRHAVELDGRTLGELGPGDVLGEVSFFQEPGARIATVRSLEPGRVMVLDRHFLERLLPAHADIACRVLFNLGRIVSGHLAMALDACAARDAERG